MRRTRWLRASRPAFLVVASIVIAGLVIASPLAADDSRMSPPPPEASNEERGAGVWSSAFTYQGTLTEADLPADGTYDFEFALFDAVSGGTQIGSTNVRDDVPVTTGVFGVMLDFGPAAFASAPRWLHIAVRPGASQDAYTPLDPRQPISAAPISSALPNVYVAPSLDFTGIGRDFRISSNETFGVRSETGANDYGGMYIETSDPGGWPFYGYATDGSFRAWTYLDGTTGRWHLYNGGERLTVSPSGILIGPSSAHSVEIQNSTGGDGLRIYDTADDGIQIGNGGADYPNYGLYIPSPGVANYGLWPNTADPSGNYALFTVDNIEAGTVTGNSFRILAVVDGSDELSAGDVVTAVGFAPPVPGAVDRLPRVRRAAAGAGAPVGVVFGRMELVPAPGKEAEGDVMMQAATGPARAGDYVNLVVLGITDVRVDGRAAVSAGMRLTASETPGTARPLRTDTLNGMTVAEDAAVIGVAVGAPGGGTVPVMVSLR